MALSSDYLLRCGAFTMDDGASGTAKADGQLGSRARRISVAEAADRLTRLGGERLCAGSDDHTLSLVRLETDEQGNWTQAQWPTTRLTGHQQLVNQVSFSPDGRWIASASFDKSVRLWNGFSGKHVATFRQHVQAVYMCCWSADARLLASASKDSTVKVYDVRQNLLKRDLPGHADEVYAIDWSVDGRAVATGGKDCRLKLWR
jgi:ribosome assembly protein 4